VLIGKYKDFSLGITVLGLIITPLVLVVLLLSHMPDVFLPSADTEAMQFIDQYISQMLEWADHVGVKYGSHVGVKYGSHVGVKYDSHFGVKYGSQIEVEYIR